MIRSPALLALALLGLGAACTTVESTTRRTLDPVVVVHGTQGDELGVSTDYGVVFLGRTAQSGRVEFTVWFGDGPNREEGLIEPMGGGLYSTGSEIQLPAVMLCFEPPPAGTRVVLRGRRGNQPYELQAELAEDPSVTGVLLLDTPELAGLGDDDVGAGVFLIEAGKPLQLLGLLSGRLQFEGGRHYFTVVGPEDMWRMVVHRRNSDRPRRWVYREDIM